VASQVSICRLLLQGGVPRKSLASQWCHCRQYGVSCGCMVFPTSVQRLIHQRDVSGACVTFPRHRRVSEVSLVPPSLPRGLSGYPGATVTSLTLPWFRPMHHDTTKACRGKQRRPQHHSGVSGKTVRFGPIQCPRRQCGIQCPTLTSRSP
jgi:hypothetical protein